MGWIVLLGLLVLALIITLAIKLLLDANDLPAGSRPLKCGSFLFFKVVPAISFFGFVGSAWLLETSRGNWLIETLALLVCFVIFVVFLCLTIVFDSNGQVRQSF